MIPNFTEKKTKEELIGHIGFSEPVSVNRQLKKKILITGKNSYIGDMFYNYVQQEEYRENFSIDIIDMLDENWEKVDFTIYDIVFHVAGIAHADVSNVSDKVKQKYYDINTNLAIRVAEKAKKSGVKRFFFMSSMIIYGVSYNYGKDIIIRKDTVPRPVNFYGDSKLQADVGLRELSSDQFKVIILRPPMIFGRGSKGNYALLSKLSKKMPIVPRVENRRSMLHIDNLCEFLCQTMLIERITPNAVVLIPQNKEWVCTVELMIKIGNTVGKKIKTSRLLKIGIDILSKTPGKIGNVINKAFGNSCYDHQISIYEGINYQRNSLEESVIKTEG